MGSSTVCFSLAIFSITSWLFMTACMPSKSKTSATKTTEFGSLVSWNVSNPEANFENKSTRSWCPFSHVSKFPTRWRITTVGICESLIVALTLNSFQHPWPGYLFKVAFGLATRGQVFFAFVLFRRNVSIEIVCLTGRSIHLPHCICPLLKVVFWKGINPKGPDP